MKNWLHVLLALLIICLSSLQMQSLAQNYMWVKGGGTNQEDATLDIHPEAVYNLCTDRNGNVYALSIVGTNPIIADTFYRSTGAYGADQNIFISSYNCQGQMRWAKLIGSAWGQQVPQSITIDSLGHVYVACDLIQGQTHIGYDTTTGSLYLREALIQFDTNGHFNWIRYVGQNNSNTLSNTGGRISPLAIDGSNNIHLLTHIGSNIALMTGDTSHSGVYDMAYNSGGTLLSADRLGFDSTWQVSGAAIDYSTNKIYVHGYRNLSSSTAHFVAALDYTHEVIWFDTLVSNGGFSDMVFDRLGHLYLCGNSLDSLTFNGHTVHNAISTSTYLSFIMKIDTNGNQQWVNHLDSPPTSGINNLFGIILMPNNKIASAGVFAIKIASSSDSLLIFSGEGQNSFFEVVDSSGLTDYLQQIHGDGFYDRANAITCDGIGSLYIGGQVGDSIYGGSIPAYHTVGGNSDFFVMKYGVDCSCTSMPLANYIATGTHTVTFTYTGTATGVDSVRWYFGDGGTSTAMNPVYTYTTPGTYTACVTVYSSCGNDEHCSIITIPCLAAPVASYTFSGIPSTTFTYTGTTAGVDSIRWHFGDGATSAVTSPVHAYTAIGTYTACVIAYSQCGNDTVCNTINIPCLSAPTAAFTESGITPAVFNYVGTTTGVDSVTWTFGDTYTATGTATSHTYTSPGSFTACVTAHSGCGNNTSCSTISIPCTVAPVASFTESGSPVSNFTYTGTTVGLDSMHWDFGDASTGSGTTTTHSYATLGSYIVCVTAYNPCGSNTSCQTITVPCVVSPVASFTSSGSGHTVTYDFTGTVTGVDSVVWNFGDGTTANSTPISHTYAVADSYHVCVTVYSQCGNDSFCNEVIIARPASVTNVAFADVQVYPNPATSELYISGVTATTQYRILTVTGQALQTGALKAGDNTLTMQSFSKGVYLLELTGIDGGKQTFRIVKD